ncbi:MAG: hypothetical protein M1830_002114 [Pleopsidium flavum]|nr:MAG: hypothetical protein M1830_002114 [Pleopsidium flavum]
MAAGNVFHQMMTAAPNPAPPNRTIPPKKSTAGRAQLLQTTIGGPGILKPESESAFGERVGPGAQLEDAAVKIRTLLKHVEELGEKRQDLERDLPRVSIEELKRLTVTRRERLGVVMEDYGKLEEQSLAGRKSMTSAAPGSLSMSDSNSDAYLRRTNKNYAIEADVLPVPDIVQTQANDITLLLGQKANLMTKLRTLDEEKTDLANELARLRLDNNNLLRKIIVSEDKVEKGRRSREDLQRNHDNTKDELAKARDDNTSATKELTDMRLEMRHLGRQIEELRSKNASVTEENQELRTEQESSKQNQRILKRDNRDCLLRCQGMVTEKEKTDRQVERLEVAAEADHKKLDELNSAILDIRNKRELLRVENTSLSAQIKRDVGEYNELVARYNNRKKDSSVAIDQMKRESTTLSEQNAELSEQMERQKLKYAEERREAALQAKSVEAEKAKLTEQLRRSSSKLDEESKQRRRFEREVKDLTDRTAALNMRVDTKTSELEKERLKHQETIEAKTALAVELLNVKDAQYAAEKHSDELRRINRDLTNNRKDLSLQLENKGIELDKAKAEFRVETNRLVTKLRGKSSDLGRLEERNQELEDVNASQKQELSAAKIRHDSDLANIQREKYEVFGKNLSLSESLTLLKSQHDTEKKRADNLQGVNESLSKQTDLLRKQVSGKSTDYAREFQLRQRLEKEKESVEAEKEGLEKDKKCLETEKEDLMREKHGLEMDKECLETDKEDLVREKKGLEKDKEDLMREKHGLEKDKKCLETEKEGLGKDNGCLEQEKDCLKQEKEGLEKDMGCLEQEKENLMTEKKGLETDKEELVREKHGLEKDKECLEKAKEHLEQDKKCLEMERECLAKAKECLEHEKEDLVRGKHGLEKDKKCLETEKEGLEKEKEGLEKDKEDLEKAKECLEHEKEDLVRENHGLEKDKKGLEKATESLEHEKEDLVREKKGLEENLAHEKRTLVDVQEELRKLSVKCRGAEQERDELKSEAIAMSNDLQYKSTEITDNSRSYAALKQETDRIVVENSELRKNSRRDEDTKKYLRKEWDELAESLHKLRVEQASEVSNAVSRKETLMQEQQDREVEELNRDHSVSLERVHEKHQEDLANANRTSEAELERVQQVHVQNLSSQRRKNKAVVTKLESSNRDHTAFAEYVAKIAGLSWPITDEVDIQQYFAKIEQVIQAGRNEAAMAQACLTRIYDILPDGYGKESGQEYSFAKFEPLVENYIRNAETHMKEASTAMYQTLEGLHLKTGDPVGYNQFVDMVINTFAAERDRVKNGRAFLNAVSKALGVDNKVTGTKLLIEKLTQTITHSDTNLHAIRKVLNLVDPNVGYEEANVSDVVVRTVERAMHSRKADLLRLKQIGLLISSELESIEPDSVVDKLSETLQGHKTDLHRVDQEAASLRHELAGYERAQEEVARLWKELVDSQALLTESEKKVTDLERQCREMQEEMARNSQAARPTTKPPSQPRSSDGPAAEVERPNLAEPSGASKRPPLPAGDAGPPTKRPRMQSPSASSGSPSTSQPQHAINQRRPEPSVSSGSPSTSQSQHANNQRRPEPSASSGSPSTSQPQHVNNQRCPEPSASSGSPSTSQSQHAINQRRPEPLVASGSVPANLTAALPGAPPAAPTPLAHPAAPAALATPAAPAPLAPHAAPAPLAIDYGFLEEGAAPFKNPNLAGSLWARAQLPPVVTAAVDAAMASWTALRPNWENPRKHSQNCVHSILIYNRGQNFPHGKGYACQRCIAETQPCVVIPKGSRPVVLPLHPSKRAQGATRQDLGFWIYQVGVRLVNNN